MLYLDSLMYVLCFSLFVWHKNGYFQIPADNYSMMIYKLKLIFLRIAAFYLARKKKLIITIMGWIRLIKWKIFFLIKNQTFWHTNKTMNITREQSLSFLTSVEP